MSLDKQNDIADGLWTKCSQCGEIIYSGELSRNFRLCPKCGNCFPMEPVERIASLVDDGSLVRYDKTNQNAVVLTGEATISGRQLVVAVIDLSYTDRSIDLFVCEGLMGAINRAADQRLPLLMTCTNDNEEYVTNGAFLPAQTLSISAAMSRLVREKLLYISVLACPNFHNRFPGFACVADIVIAESSVSEAAPRVNQKKRGETVPAVQALLQSGMADMIIPRKELRHTIIDILNFFC